MVASCDLVVICVMVSCYDSPYEFVLRLLWLFVWIIVVVGCCDISFRYRSDVGLLL